MSQDALREADRRKDEFLATLSHELRNPLAPIRNALEVLRMRAATTSRAERAHAIMERQLQQLVRLTDDLLDVSRITRNRMELRREPHRPARRSSHSAIETSAAADRRGRHMLERRRARERRSGWTPTSRASRRRSATSSTTPRSTPIAAGTSRSRPGDARRQAVVAVTDTGIGIRPRAAAHLRHVHAGRSGAATAHAAGSASAWRSPSG